MPTIDIFATFSKMSPPELLVAGTAAVGALVFLANKAFSMGKDQQGKDFFEAAIEVSEETGASLDDAVKHNGINNEMPPH